MRLELLRFSSQSDDTLGVLFDDMWHGRKFLCYTLEDEYRPEKVSHETRIPSGTYRIRLRPPSEGSVNGKYSALYPDDHVGMLWLQDVPGFEWIYIHQGNDDDHTSGCILVGDGLDANHRDQDGKVWNSGGAYIRLYRRVLAEMDKGNPVYIQIIDYDEV